MNNIAKGCLRLLLLYLACAAIVGIAVHHRVGILPVAIWSGLIAGFFLWLSLSFLLGIPMHLLEWWRFRPGAKPRDGKRSGVFGTIQAAGHTLHSPFTRTACVSYHYKILNYAGETHKTDYEGFALVPSAIATDDGLIRVLAYPELDVAPERVFGNEHKSNAKRYIEATTFTDTVSGGIKGMLRELKGLLFDDDGSIRYDYRISPVAPSLDMCRFEERVLRSGDSVMAVGIYSEEKRALVPDPNALMHAITIRSGPPGKLRRAPLRKAFGSVIGAVIVAALLAGAALFFLVNAPLDAAEQKNPDRRFFWEEVKLERWLERELRRPLANSDVLDTQGMYFVELCDGCAKGKLEVNGRTFELKHASGWQSETARRIHLATAPGETDGVTMSLDRVSRRREIAIVMNGKTFVVPEGWLAPRDYEDSLDGASTMDGRVTVMAPNGEVKVRASFRAPLESR